MRMRDVARYFDRNPAYDAYSGAFAFNCSYSNYDSATSDGSTNRRRTLSVAHNTRMPARGVITLAGGKWVVGESIEDSFQGTVVRDSFVVKKVTDLMRVLTPAQACANAAGIGAYAQKFYFKDTVDARTTAEYDTFWNVFFSKSEPVGKGTFLCDEAGIFYRVRQVYAIPEGFNIAQTDQLEEDARQAGVVFETGAYDPVADEITAGTVTTDVLQVKPSEFYHFDVRAEADLKPGDKMVFVAASALTPKQGMLFTMLGKKWQVMLAKPDKDAYALLARLA